MFARKNFGYSTVATAPSPATSGTSLVVQAGDGANFIANHPATIYPSGSNPLATNAEIVLVTAVSTDTLTITRTQESTSARTVVVGDQISQSITALTVKQLEQYDLIVDAAGNGDYTTLGAAITASSNNFSIFIRTGSYTESAITSSLTNLNIVGENPEQVILNGGANALTFSGTKVNFKNVAFTFSTGGLTLSGTYSKADGCHIASTADAQVLTLSGNFTKFVNGRVIDTVASAVTSQKISMGGTHSQFIDNYCECVVKSAGGQWINPSGNNTSVSTNVFRMTSSSTTASLIQIGGTNVRITNNTIDDTTSNNATIFITAANNGLIANNTVTGGLRFADLSSNTARIIGNTWTTTVAAARGIVALQKVNATGNFFETTGGSPSQNGIDLSSSADNSIIMSNEIKGFSIGINIQATADNVMLFGNQLISNTTPYADAATTTHWGNMMFDATVDSSGMGQYTTVAAAITAGHTRIFVKKGTYTETATNTSTANLVIVGESPEDTILTLSDTNSFQWNGNYGYISNIKFTSSAANSGGGFTSSGTNQSYYNVHFAGTGANTSIIGASGSNNTFVGCQFECVPGVASASRISISGGNTAVLGCNFQITANKTSNVLVNIGAGSFVGNTFNYANQASAAAVSAVNFSNTSTEVSNNYFKNNALDVGIKVAITANNQMWSSNYFINFDTALNITGTGFCTIVGNNIIQNNVTTPTGINDASSGDNTISNNVIFGRTTSLAGTGLTAVTTGNSMIGNRIKGYATGFSISTGSDNTFSQNNVTGNTTAISDTATATDMTGNTGADINNEKRFVYMKNTSGGTINAGNLVVLKAVAAGDEVTTTTTAGDNKIFGIAAAAITNNSYGKIQIAGKTTILTANGTVAIAVGDFLTASTNAGIAVKGVATNTVIAIALEAYSTADSNGVLDALIIPPRLI